MVTLVTFKTLKDEKWYLIVITLSIIAYNICVNCMVICVNVNYKYYQLPKHIYTTSKKVVT